MRIRLSEERRRDLASELRDFWRESFDEELSAYRAERVLAFLTKRLGAPVYNQAVADVVASLSERMEDLQGELYEPEPPRPRPERGPHSPPR